MQPETKPPEPIYIYKGSVLYMELEAAKIEYIRNNQNSSQVAYSDLSNKFHEQIEILRSKQNEINNDLSLVNHYMDNQNDIIVIYYNTLNSQKLALDQYIEYIKDEFKEIDKQRNTDSKNRKLYSLNLALIDCNILLYNQRIQNYETRKNNFLTSNSLLRKNNLRSASAELLGYTVAGIISIVVGLTILSISVYKGVTLFWLENPSHYLTGFILGGISTGIGITCYGSCLIKKRVYNPYKLFNTAKKLEECSTALSKTKQPQCIYQRRL